MGTDGSALGYAELLRLAVSKGLQELDATVVQIPSEENRGHAVVVAAARTTAAVFRAVGEARVDSLPAPQRDQALVVAEMRAKTRALCEAVGMPQPLPSDAAAPQAAPAPLERSAVAAARSEEPVRAEIVRIAAPAAESSPVGVPDPGAEPLRTSIAIPPRTAAPVAITAPATGRPVDGPLDEPVRAAQSGEPSQSRTRPPAARPITRPAPSPAEGLGPDILQKLLQMTRRISELKHEEIGEDEALAKLDSFFLRAFSHPLAEGTRMEGQRVVQRLAADLSRLSQVSDDGALATG